VSLLGTLVLAGLVAPLDAAFGYWTSGGAGSGAAAASTLGAPTGVTRTASGSAVTLTWGAATVPAGATLSGYYVLRDDGAGDQSACDSDDEDLLPADATGCVDSAVPNGTWTYQVVAVLDSWSATASATPVTVTDSTVPTMTLGTGASSGAWLGTWNGTRRLYFKQNAAGSVELTATVTDTGVGPDSATFPAIATFGWTHNVETVTSGSGSAPTVTYTSSPFTWLSGASTPATRSVVGRDLAGNSRSQNVTFAPDIAAPGNGALAVNGVTATAGPTGSTSSSTSGSFTIGTRTDYTEVQSSTRSGLLSSTLIRESAPLTGGACGAFTGATTLVGNPAQGPLPTGCYRYALTGTDRVGNTASRVTTVRVETSAPQDGALTANGTAATAGGSTSVSATGSWTLARTDWTDPDSGATSTLVRTQAPLSNGVCGAFSGATTLTGAPNETGTPRTCYRYVLTGTNAFGQTASVTTTVMVGPYVSALQLLNGTGTAGRASAGDRVVVTFSDTVNPKSMCSTWTTSGDQSLAGDNQVTVSVNNSGGSDTLSVAATGCTFNLGSFSLGSTGYTSSTATFAGAGVNRSTITWTAASRTLTITLGATGSASLGTVGSSIVTYTPSTAIQNSSGVALGGTFATAALQQF
jgi:hypothetical protein